MRGTLRALERLIVACYIYKTSMVFGIFIYILAVLSAIPMAVYMPTSSVDLRTMRGSASVRAYLDIYKKCVPVIESGGEVWISISDTDLLLDA